MLAGRIIPNLQIGIDVQINQKDSLERKAT